MTKVFLVTVFLLSLGTLSLAAASVPAPEPVVSAGGLNLAAGIPP